VCEGLTKRFGTFTAVDHASFSVEKGRSSAFSGQMVSGKSTVIRMLCGILEPTEGTARIGGHDVVTDTESIKDMIGYMSQKFSLYDELTVDENLIFSGKLYGLGGRALTQRRDELIGITLWSRTSPAGIAALRRMAAAPGDGVFAHAQTNGVCF